MGVDLGALRAKLEELKTGQKQMDGDYLDKFLNVQDGETNVRILPGKEGVQFYSETAIHRMNDKNIHCLGRQTCPICRYVSKLYDSKDEKLTEVARRIKAKKRFYFNVVARELKSPTSGEMEKNVGPKIFSCGIKLFEKILSTFVDDDFGDLTDLDKGWDFKIIRKEKDGYPNYDDSRPRPKSCPASENKEDTTKWMGGLHDLQALISRKSTEELQGELDQFVARESMEIPALSNIVVGRAASKVVTEAKAEAPKAKAPESPKAATVETAEETGETEDDFLAQLKEMKAKKA